MIFPINNKFVEVILNQSQCLGMQSQIAIAKHKIIETCLNFDYLKICVHKYLIHATGCQVAKLNAGRGIFRAL